MKYDKWMVIGIIGSLSTISGEILTQVLKYFGIAKYGNYGLASLLVTFNRPSITIGIIVDFLIGSVVAVLMYFALEKFGSDYLIIKTTIFGLLAWLFTELAFTSTIEGRFFDIRPMSDYYAHILGAAVYGATIGVLFRKYLFRGGAQRR